MSVALALASLIAARASLGSAPDGKVAGIRFLDEHAGTFLILAILQGISTALLIGPLGFLYIATRYRRPELPRLLRGLVVAAPIVYGALFVIRQIDVNSIAGDVVPKIAGEPGSSKHAKDLIDERLSGGSLAVLSGITFAAQLAVGAAIVFVSQHARRAGLLSPFMGILGIIVGVLLAIPVFGSFAVVQFFWVAALGVLFLNRWPQARGPAWETGEADAWPSAAEVRAALDSADDGDSEAAPEPEVEGIEEESEAGAAEPARPAHPASKKRKRKRRR